MASSQATESPNPPPPPATTNQTPLFKSFIAGSVGGGFLVIAGHPLDTIKVRLQTQPLLPNGKPSLYNGTADCVRKIFQKEGFKGFYKGMAAPLAGMSPIFAVCFFSFTLGKKAQQKSDDHVFTPVELLLAGGFAGLNTTVIMAPGERIKCLLQVQNANPSGAKTMYKGPIDCAKQLYRQGGIRNLYVGTVATASRDIPSTGIYFMSYDYFQQLLLPEGKTKDQLSPLRTLLAGGMAGVLNWVVAIPPDVLKSRQQTAPPGTYSGILDVLKKTVKTDGVTGLYKGVTPVMIRAFFANAACFLGLELTMKLLNYLSP